MKPTLSLLRDTFSSRQRWEAAVHSRLRDSNNHPLALVNRLRRGLDVGEIIPQNLLSILSICRQYAAFEHSLKVLELWSLHPKTECYFKSSMQEASLKGRGRFPAQIYRTVLAGAATPHEKLMAHREMLRLFKDSIPPELLRKGGGSDSSSSEGIPSSSSVAVVAVPEGEEERERGSVALSLSSSSSLTSDAKMMMNQTQQKKEMTQLLRKASFLLGSLPKNQLAEVSSQGNPALERYYIQQGIVTDPLELDEVLKCYRTPPATFVRVQRSHPAADLAVLQLQDLKCLHPVRWYPEKNTVWRLDRNREKADNDISERDVVKARRLLDAFFKDGIITFQSSSSLLPGLYLQPEPHHHVLDMCAAPGSKTTQIADLMKHGIFLSSGRLVHTGSGRNNNDNISRSDGRFLSNDEGLLFPQGVLIANELAGDRWSQLRHRVADKYLNVVCTPFDATNPFPYLQNAPDVFRKFHRILVDAQCSSDGRLNRDLSLWNRWSPMTGLFYHFSQVAMLRQAVQLAEPDALIVYSTCSLNPIENEAVIHTLLREGSVELVPLPSTIEGLWSTEEEIIMKGRRKGYMKSLRPGMTSWGIPQANGSTWKHSLSSSSSFRVRSDFQRLLHRQDVSSLQPPSLFSSSSSSSSKEVKAYEEALKNGCVRIVPHCRSDLDAFFIAVLRKLPLDEKKKQESSSKAPTQSVMRGRDERYISTPSIFTTITTSNSRTQFVSQATVTETDAFLSYFRTYFGVSFSTDRRLSHLRFVKKQEHDERVDERVKSNRTRKTSGSHHSSPPFLTSSSMTTTRETFYLINHAALNVLEAGQQQQFETTENTTTYRKKKKKKTSNHEGEGNTDIASGYTPTNANTTASGVVLGSECGVPFAQVWRMRTTQGCNENKRSNGIINRMDSPRNVASYWQPTLAAISLCGGLCCQSSNNIPSSSSSPSNTGTGRGLRHVIENVPLRALEKVLAFSTTTTTSAPAIEHDNNISANNSAFFLDPKSFLVCEDAFSSAEDEIRRGAPKSVPLLSHQEESTKSHTSSGSFTTLPVLLPLDPIHAHWINDMRQALFAALSRSLREEKDMKEDKLISNNSNNHTDDPDNSNNVHKFIWKLQFPSRLRISTTAGNRNSQLGSTPSSLRGTEGNASNSVKHSEDTHRTFFFCVEGKLVHLSAFSSSQRKREPSKHSEETIPVNRERREMTEKDYVLAVRSATILTPEERDSLRQSLVFAIRNVDSKSNHGTVQEPEAPLFANWDNEAHRLFAQDKRSVLGDRGGGPEFVLTARGKSQVQTVRHNEGTVVSRPSEKVLNKPTGGTFVF